MRLCVRCEDELPINFKRFELLCEECQADRKPKPPKEQVKPLKRLIRIPAAEFKKIADAFLRGETIPRRTPDRTIRPQSKPRIEPKGW